MYNVEAEPILYMAECPGEMCEQGVAFSRDKFEDQGGTLYFECPDCGAEFNVHRPLSELAVGGVV